MSHKVAVPREESEMDEGVESLIRPSEFDEDRCDLGVNFAPARSQAARKANANLSCMLSRCSNPPYWLSSCCWEDASYFSVNFDQSCSDVTRLNQIWPDTTSSDHT